MLVQHLSMEKNFKLLKNAVVNRIDISQRKQFDVTQSTIHYHSKKVSLKYYKHQMPSKYNKNQFEQVAEKVLKN